MSEVKGKASLVGLLLGVAVAALLINSPVDAGPPGPPAISCSVATLNGPYGVSFQFLNTDPGSVPATIGSGTHTAGAGIGRVVFDGQGGFSGQETISFGGLIIRPAVWGNYSVNPDCTGSMSMIIGGDFTAQFDFVLVDAGRELRGLSTVDGDIAFNVWKKQ